MPSAKRRSTAPALDITQHFIENAVLNADGERLKFNNTGKKPVKFILKYEGENYGPLFQAFTTGHLPPVKPCFIHQKGDLKGTTAWLDTRTARKMAKAAGVEFETF
jgi:hypothetical protein